MLIFIIETISSPINSNHLNLNSIELNCHAIIIQLWFIGNEFWFIHIYFILTVFMWSDFIQRHCFYLGKSKTNKLSPLINSYMTLLFRHISPRFFESESSQI